MTRSRHLNIDQRFDKLLEGVGYLRLTEGEKGWAMPLPAAPAAGANAPEPASRLGLSAASVSRGDVL